MKATARESVDPQRNAEAFDLRNRRREIIFKNHPGWAGFSIPGMDGLVTIEDVGADGDLRLPWLCDQPESAAGDSLATRATG